MITLLEYAMYGAGGGALGYITAVLHTKWRNRMTYTCGKCGSKFKNAELAKCGRCKPLEFRRRIDDINADISTGRREADEKYRPTMTRHPSGKPTVTRDSRAERQKQQDHMNNRPSLASDASSPMPWPVGDTSSLRLVDDAPAVKAYEGGGGSFDGGGSSGDWSSSDSGSSSSDSGGGGSSSD